MASTSKLVLHQIQEANSGITRNISVSSGNMRCELQIYMGGHWAIWYISIFSIKKKFDYACEK